MIGEQIGALKIIAELGAGGMGTVYLAEHAVLKDRRAIKVLNPQFTKFGAIVARFVDEARATAALRHRHLVRVFDIGQLPSGAWFSVMEYLEGGTLLRFMASQGGPLAPYLIVHVLAPVLSCMHWVHGNGVVHRDLKPENIFLIQEGDNPHFVKVLDLGVAQLSEDFASGPRTKTGTVIGTPLYMAPEALRGQRVTRAADVFAVGVIAYEMATGGWFPWQREESRAEYSELAPAELCHRQLTSPPVDPRLRFPQLRAELAETILALLDVDPARRPDDRAAALRLAEAAATDGVNPDGLAVLREVAPDLVKADALLETIRSHRGLVEPAAAAAADARYQLGQKLGAGGMAEVFLGTRLGAEGFERRVAIKRVLAGYSDDPAFEQMFTAEARLLCQLAHPNIVGVIDFSRDADGRLFLVMEYVDGRDLAALAATGPLPVSAIIYVVAEILRGLGYAHDLPDPGGGGRGLVHRDVTPRNVLLSNAGEVKVADFGLARMRDASGQVRTDAIRGTPVYMSPEQCAGEPLDGRSDLCAVGTILWELLTGKPMYSGTPHEVVGQVLFKPLQPPSAIVGGRAPLDLEAVAMRLLARDRAERYPTARAALDDLLRCADAPRDGRGELAQLLAARFAGGGAPGAAVVPAPTVASRRGRAAAQMTAAPPPSTLAGSAAQAVPARPSRQRRRLLAGLGAGLLVGGVVSLLVVGVGRSSREGAGGPSPELAIAGDAGAAAVAAPDGGSAAADRATAPPGAAGAGLTVRGDAAVRSAAVDAAGLAGAGEAAAPLPVAPDAAVPVGLAPPRPAAGDASGSAGGSASTPRPPPGTPSQGVGELVVLVKPWATLWMDGKAAGDTPYRAALPAGRHSLRLVNEERGKTEWITVTVTPGRTTTIERNW